MRVLCGQCGHVHRLDDGYDQPTVTCQRCGHVVPVGGLGVGQPAGPGPQPATAQAEEVGFAEQARQTNGRKVTITCPNCGKTVTVSARVSGRNARCKGCDHPIVIPYPDDLESFDLPRRPSAVAEREDGLELVAPPDEPGHEEPVPVALAEPEPQDELELSPLELVDLDGEPATEGDVHDPVAALAAIDPAAHLAALDQASRSSEALAPPEPPQDAGQLVSAVQDFHGDKQAALVRGRRQAGRPSRTVQWIVLAAIGCAAIALPLGVVIPILTTEEPPEVDIGTDGGNGDPSTRVAGTGGNPATRKGGLPTQPHSRPIPKPRKATCEVLSAAARPFAADGYFAAPPRSIYWKITARITAGDEPVFFDTHGQDVRLVVGKERYDSLGEPASGGGFLPIRSRKTTVSLKAGESRTVSFLIEAPRDLQKCALYVRRVGLVDLALPPLPGTPPPEQLAGTYQEVAPRNLRPVLRDPVMAAIQAAPQQKLVVGRAAEGIDVAIPTAQVRGLGRQVAPGLFQTPLKRGEHTLQTTVRFVEGGRRLILYLAEQPFHQLTYVNPEAKLPPEPVAVFTPPASAEDPRAAGGVPRGIPAGPGLEKSDPWRPRYDPNSRPRGDEKLPTGPSIFD